MRKAGLSEKQKAQEYAIYSEALRRKSGGGRKGKKGKQGAAHVDGASNLSHLAVVPLFRGRPRKDSANRSLSASTYLRLLDIRSRLRRLLLVAAARAAWDESKHPRGQPGNPGQFAKAEGGGGDEGAKKRPGRSDMYPEHLPAPGWDREKNRQFDHTFEHDYRKSEEPTDPESWAGIKGGLRAEPLRRRRHDDRYPGPRGGRDATLAINHMANRGIVRAVRDAWNAAPAHLRQFVPQVQLTTKAIGSGVYFHEGPIGIGAGGTMPGDDAHEYYPYRLVSEPPDLDTSDEKAVTAGRRRAQIADVARVLLHELGHSVWYEPDYMTDDERTEFGVAVMAAGAPLTGYVDTYTNTRILRMHAALADGEVLPGPTTQAGTALRRHAEGTAALEGAAAAMGLDVPHDPKADRGLELRDAIWESQGADPDHYIADDWRGPRDPATMARMREFVAKTIPAGRLGLPPDYYKTAEDHRILAKFMDILNLKSGDMIRNQKLVRAARGSVRALTAPQRQKMHAEIARAANSLRRGGDRYISEAWAEAVAAFEGPGSHDDYFRRARKYDYAVLEKLRPAYEKIMARLRQDGYRAKGDGRPSLAPVVSKGWQPATPRKPLKAARADLEPASDAEFQDLLDDLRSLANQRVIRTGRTSWSVYLDDAIVQAPDAASEEDARRRARGIASGDDQMPSRKSRIASLRARLRMLRAGAEWDESKHPRGQPGNPGQFVEAAGGGSFAKGVQTLPRDEYIAELRGIVTARVGGANQEAENVAAGLRDVADSFIEAAADTRIDEDEEDGEDDEDESPPWTVLDQLRSDLRNAGVRATTIDADTIEDWLRGGVFAGGALSPKALGILWDAIDSVDAAGDMHSRLGDAAREADRETQAQYDTTNSFGRGMSVEEFRESAARGETGSAQSDKGFASASADPAVAFGFALNTDAHGDGVLVEYDGDAVRASGAARPVQYNYVAQDGPAYETWDSDLPLSTAGQLEVRIKTGVPLNRLRPHSVTFVAEPTADDLAAARRMVGPDGAVRVLSSKK